MEGETSVGGKRGVTVKTLKRILKRNGLKTTGKKATLTRRAKKARLMSGGEVKQVVEGLGTAVKGVAKIPGDVAKGVIGGRRHK